jgi:L-alanine-DL-glutamate epimerase-like enolase superfamily enzyme
LEATVQKVAADFEREPLLRPFGFKGAYVGEIWQSVAFLESASGAHGLGLGSQNVLWSDPGVFVATSEAGGNALMFALTERALRLVEGRSFASPVELQEEIFPEVLQYGRSITGRPDLRKTFALNALVAVDNAAWMLHARSNGIGSFDELIPPEYRAALAHRGNRVASVPVVSYSMPLEEVGAALDQGFFTLKLKLGHPGTQREMLAADMQRLTLVHRNFGARQTANGPLLYYLDFNGRYESGEMLLRFLEQADKIGAMQQIALVEEPFPESCETEVHDLPVRVAADESAHTPEDVSRRIEMGYGAIALKPAAKTLSMTLKMARVAHERGVPCFCADLTVNPILVDWNKNVAARLAPLPGWGMGLLEANGHQNYRDWQRLKSYHPCDDAPWIEPRDGVFHLDDEFYLRSGGVLMSPAHYLHLVQSPSSHAADDRSS